MEEEVKISFWKKLKISIFGLEDYKKLAIQKISKTIAYVVILMLIFAFFLTSAITYKFSRKINLIRQYIEQNTESIEYKDGKLTIVQKENFGFDVDRLFDTKIIINTDANITNETIDEYTEKIKNYDNGVVILADKIILKTQMSGFATILPLTELADSANIVRFNKQDILNILSGNNIYMLYMLFYVVMYIYIYIIYLSTILLNAIIYSILGYITGTIANMRMRYKNVYNIAIYSSTLPIVLNLICIIINILTGYTIKYFYILYVAVTCIYIISAILIIRSDIIKQHMELSKIIKEQEKVKQEMEERERKKKEEAEKERIRRKDEKERKEQKKNKNGKTPSDKEGKEPEPQANIKPEEL